MNEPAAVTINGRTYKLGPGEGTGKLTGPRLDLKPGTYKTSTMIGAKPPDDDRFNVGEDDEIFGAYYSVLALACTFKDHREDVPTHTHRPPA